MGYVSVGVAACGNGVCSGIPVVIRCLRNRGPRFYGC